MSYFDFETVAWVDPYMLKAEHHFDTDDADQMQANAKLQKMADRRQNTCAVLHWQASPSVPKPQLVFHPVEVGNTYFTVGTASNSTFCCATKNLQIHFFDQEGKIAGASLKLQGSTQVSGTAAGGKAGGIAQLGSLITGVANAPVGTFIDAKDSVTRLFMDPLGRHVIVVFQSGACLMFHIKKGDKAPTRHDLVVPGAVSGLSQFTVESVGWDIHNEFETGSGDILIGSQKGGVICACRLESGGVNGIRKLFSFPVALAKAPIHSIAMVFDADDNRRRTVLVAIENRLYFFSGRAGLESMFEPFLVADVISNFISVPSVASGASPPTSSVSILRYAWAAKFPAAFSWSYGDVVVQGEIKSSQDIVPFVDDPSVDPQTSTAHKVTPLRIVNVFDASEIVSKLKQFLSLEIASYSSLMASGGSKGTAAAAASRSRGLSMTGAAAAPTPAADKIVKIVQTMFHLVITTTSRVYCFASSPILPFDFLAATGCAICNRLVTQFPLGSSEPAFAPGAKGQAAKPILDALFTVDSDRFVLNKFYTFTGKDIQEIELPSQKRQFAMLFIDAARSIWSARAKGGPPSLKQKIQLKVRRDTALRGSGKAQPLTGAVQEMLNRVPIGSRPVAACPISYSDLFLCAHVLSKKQTKMEHVVNQAHGAFQMLEGKYAQAVMSLAKSPRYGVDAAIMELSSLPTTDALISFLNEKLLYIAETRKSLDDKLLEATALSTWLCALLLDKCTDLYPHAKHAVSANFRVRNKTPGGMLENNSMVNASICSSGGAGGGGGGGGAPSASSASQPSSAWMTLESSKTLLDLVMAREKDFLPWEPVRQALFSIGSMEQILHICRELGKFKELVVYFVHHERFYDALSVLIENCADFSYYSVWERYSLQLIQHYPVRLIKKGWIENGSALELDPLRLIPALSHYDQSHNETKSDSEGPSERLPTNSSQALMSDYEQVTEHVGITYLRHIIVEYGSTDKALHNLLLAELAKFGSDDELVQFINNSDYYDEQAAVRLCVLHNRVIGCIHLYFKLGHAHQAVSLALHQHNEALAKALIKRTQRGSRSAQTSDDAERLRQSLWKLVISYVASRQDGPLNALLVAGESNGDVNVSHVLPYLPPTVMICEFKTELQDNVAHFGLLMKGVQEDIQVSKKDSETLRSDLTVESKTATKFSLSKKCDACSQIVASKTSSAIIIFRGCGHAFHRSCYNNRIEHLTSLKQAMASSNPFAANHNAPVTHQQLLIEECYLCSPAFIRVLISTPTSVRLDLENYTSITI